MNVHINVCLCICTNKAVTKNICFDRIVLPVRDLVQQAFY